MKNKLTALISASGLLLASSASATLIVDFTHSASSFVTAAGRDTNAGGNDVWSFDDVNPLWDGTAPGTNTRIVGGMSFTWASGTSYDPLFRLVASNSNLNIQLAPSPNTGLNRISGMLAWQKVDFLNGASSQTVAFGTGSSLEINFTTFNAATAPTTTSDIRFVVQQGGNYYVSNTSKTDLTTGLFSIDPSSVTWSQVNTSSYTYGSFSSLALTDVQAVGLYVDMTRTSGNLQVQFNDFKATAIPEPSTYAALAGLGALGLVALRRLRK